MNSLEAEVRLCSSTILGRCELLLPFIPYKLDELGIGLKVSILSLKYIYYNISCHYTNGQVYIEPLILFPFFKSVC